MGFSRVSQVTGNKTFFSPNHNINHTVVATGRTASAEESIFTYSGADTWASISTAGADFTPKFLDVLLAEASEELMNQVNAACGEGDAADTTCQFDALATENPNIGTATKATGEKFVETTDALG